VSFQLRAVKTVELTTRSHSNRQSVVEMSFVHHTHSIAQNVQVAALPWMKFTSIENMVFTDRACL
jgi:chloramphenicol O-acetyltransferase